MFQFEASSPPLVSLSSLGEDRGKREPKHNPKTKRQQRYRRGLRAELIAAAFLMAKGYRILQWRAKTHLGEIDLIARRGKRLAFVEVKHRATLAQAQAAISPAQQKRLRRAAQSWVGQRPQYHDHEIGMDAIFICPWRWPDHQMNVFYDA